jgi:hypothetical protein
VSAQSAPSAPTAGSAVETVEYTFAEDDFAGGSVQIRDAEGGFSNTVAITASTATSGGKVSLDLNVAHPPYTSAADLFILTDANGVRWDADYSSEPDGDTLEVQNIRPSLHPTAGSVSGQSAPSAPTAGSVSGQAAPTAPSAGSVSGQSAPSAPTAASVAGDSAPSAPTPVVLTGQTPPSTSTPIETVDMVFVSHTDTLDALANYYVKVGARASAVTIDLPASPAEGQLIIVADSSGQAATYNITIDPGDEDIDGENETIVINNGSGVYRLRWDLDQWKIE